MKQLITLIAFVLIGMIGNAQFIYSDFDGNQNVTFTGWPNSPSVIANPDASGINTSANVAEFIRSTEQWAHSFVELDGKIDFTTGNNFQLKVWSPIACEVLFKLEDKTNSAVFVEVSGNVTTPNQWEQLTYDFSGTASGTYDKIVIFFDFASSTDNTFYFDDVEGPEYGGGTVLDPVTLPVTFDDTNVNYALVDFGGNVSQIVEDPTNSANMVAQSLKTAGAEIWAGTTIGGTTGFPEPIPFSAGETYMNVRVWSPTANTPVRLKVEDSGDPTISVETEVMTTVAAEWETLEFDFSNEAPGTAEINFANDYNKASIFFNFGTNGADDTYYWDDVKFGMTTSVAEQNAQSLSFLQNPVNDLLVIDFEENLRSVQVYNLSGQSVRIEKTGMNQYDVSALHEGVYTVVATDEKGTIFTGKILKK
ncbi:MAG: T9SS type A sorting domain-containing protein [Bacteroidales bacterium]|nr:T9SS type A sorting domain-containing protein [Bacteroidales bacterium]